MTYEYLQTARMGLRGGLPEPTNRPALNLMSDKLADTLRERMMRDARGSKMPKFKKPSTGVFAPATPLRRTVEAEVMKYKGGGTFTTADIALRIKETVRRVSNPISRMEDQGIIRRRSRGNKGQIQWEVIE